MRVAIVSYFAPPQTAVAGHRVLRMTRALLRAGHHVHWICADSRRLPDLDPSLAPLIPEAVVLHPLGGQALVTKAAADNLWEKVWRSLAFTLPRHLALPDGFLGWRWILRPRPCGRRQVCAPAGWGRARAGFSRRWRWAGEAGRTCRRI